MINPQVSVAQILLNNPDLAVPLFDLLIWANQPNLVENGDYQELLKLAFVNLQAYEDARDAYAKKRVA